MTGFGRGLADIAFADRGRAVKVVAALALAAFFAWWGADERAGRCVTIEDALAHPQACDGSLVALGLTRAGPVDRATFGLRYGGKTHVFAQTDPPVEREQYLSVRGVFTAPDAFRPVFVHRHRSRGLKLGVSLLALAGVAAYAARAFRPGGGRPDA